MRIGIDYRFAARTARGIGKYIKELVRELMVIDKHNDYILYLDHDTELHLPDNFSKKVLPYRNILLFEQVYLPKQAKNDQLDILWYPSNSGALFLDKQIKLVVTVHDLISFLDYNSVRKISFTSLKYRAGEYYRKLALSSGLSRIDKLLTVSEYSAAEIERILGRESVVIYNNISPIVSSNGISRVLERFNLKSGEYFFSITGDAPHKNLQGLLDIFSDPSVRGRLVISGVKDSAIIKKYPVTLREKVVFTGYITDQEKLCLYQHAKAFLFLSFCEGFGIPVLEAMQFNLPVIASNRSSVPEVAGQGACLIDPDDHAGIKMLISRIAQIDRQELQKQQALQLETFSSWRRSAFQLLRIFEGMYAKI